MIRKISTVSIFVTDYDAAKTFYTDKLGFEVRRDNAFGDEGQRWVEVAPPGAETVAVLYKPDDNWRHYEQVIGQSQALTFEVENIRAFVESLRQKGVTIAQEPFDMPFGTFAYILDQDDNRLILVG